MSDSPEDMIQSCSGHHSAVKVSFKQVAENIFWGIKTVIESSSQFSDLLSRQVRVLKHRRYCIIESPVIGHRPPHILHETAKLGAGIWGCYT